MRWDLIIAYRRAMKPRWETIYQEMKYVPRSSSSSVSVTQDQNAAVADNSGEVERQRQIAEYERQQQEIRHTQQLELVRQNVLSELQLLTQSNREEAAARLQEQEQSNIEEATIAIGYVRQLTETALNQMNDKPNEQTQEQQQMAADDERTRQMVTARKNQLRNQEKEQESSDRAKPKGKTELEPNTIPAPPVNDAPKKTNVIVFYSENKYKIRNPF